MSPGRHTARPAPAAAPQKDAKGTGVGLIQSLVGIRGVFSAVVVLVHLAPYAIALAPVLGPVMTAFWHNAYWVLDLFFVLSGFVITAGYGKRFTGWPGFGVWGRFLWARLSRFYPLHLAVLLALVAAVLVGRATGFPVPHGGDLGFDLLRQITLTQGWGGAQALTWNGPTWSLSSEWFCYMILPLLLPVVMRVRSTPALLVAYVVSCAIPLVAYAFLGYDDPQITYISPLYRAIGWFLAGAFLFRLTQNGSRLPDLAGRSTGPLCVASLALVGVLGWFQVSQLYSVPLSALVILALSRQRGAVDRFLSTPFMLKAGDLSVALFLVHVPVIIATSVVITPERFPGAWGWLGIALVVAAVLLVSWLGFVLVERPAQRLMSKVARRKVHAVLPVGGVALGKGS